MDDSEKERRLLEAAVSILQAVPDKKLNVVVLNKALFYLDLVALRDTGETVTKNTYIALKLGPVIAKYPSRLVKKLTERGYAEQCVTKGRSKPIRLIKKPQISTLSENEEKLAAQVGAKLAQHVTSNEISVFSHDNIGWEIAYRSGLGAGGTAQAIDLGIAMQQIMDDDPWLGEPVDPSILQSISPESDQLEEW